MACAWPWWSATGPAPTAWSAPVAPASRPRWCAWRTSPTAPPSTGPCETWSRAPARTWSAWPGSCASSALSSYGPSPTASSTPIRACCPPSAAPTRCATPSPTACASPAAPSTWSTRRSTTARCCSRRWCRSRPTTTSSACTSASSGRSTACCRWPPGWSRRAGCASTAAAPASNRWSEDPDVSDRQPIRRALISVFDKEGLDRLASALRDAGVEVVSTGSTAAVLEGCGLAVTRVEELTGFPECLDGRVKTLHPRVHAGLLADLRLESHAAQLDELGIAPFELLVSNLYPFTETVASGASDDECVEQIDIGGPAMVRAAAKNFPSVAVVTSPAAYPDVEEALQSGGFTLAERRALAATAFAHIAEYDVAVADWFARGTDGDFAGLALRRAATLRYGENPHQTAALY